VFRERLPSFAGDVDLPQLDEVTVAIGRQKQALAARIERSRAIGGLRLFRRHAARFFRRHVDDEELRLGDRDELPDQEQLAVA
jgi:hypothetical protein